MLQGPSPEPGTLCRHHGRGEASTARGENVSVSLIAGRGCWEPADQLEGKLGTFALRRSTFGAAVSFAPCKFCSWPAASHLSSTWEKPVLWFCLRLLHTPPQTHHGFQGTETFIIRHGRCGRWSRISPGELGQSCSAQRRMMCSLPPLVSQLCSDHVWLRAQFCRDIQATSTFTWCVQLRTHSSKCANPSEHHLAGYQPIRMNESPGAPSLLGRAPRHQHACGVHHGRTVTVEATVTKIPQSPHHCVTWWRVLKE